MKLKHAIYALLLCAMLAGCREEEVKSDMANEIEAERQLRYEAEARAEREAGGKSRWEFAAFVLGIAALAAFIGGTAVGSRGKRHAGS